MFSEYSNVGMSDTRPKVQGGQQYGDMPWQVIDPRVTTSDAGDGSISDSKAINITAMMPEEGWRDLGYTGPLTEQIGSGDGASGPQTSPQFIQWLDDNGYQVRAGSRAYEGDEQGRVTQIFDRSGQPVGEPYKYGENDDAFLVAAIMAGGVMGSAAAGVGAAAGGAGGAAGTAGGAGGYAGGYEAAGAIGAGGGGGAGAVGAGSSVIGSGGGVGGYAGGYEAAGVGSAGGAAGAGSSWIPGVSNGQAVGVGANLLGGYLSSNAAGNAADAQTASAREANDLLRYMYDTTRTDNLPALDARNAGIGGYRNLLANPGSITQDPGYQFGLKEGTGAIDRSAASRGGLFSGQTIKAQQRFGQDYAGSKFDNALNRYGNLAGMGQVGAGTIANAGSNYGNQAGQNITGAGNARASGYVGQANAWNNALSGGYNAWQDQEMMDLYRRRGY